MKPSAPSAPCETRLDGLLELIAEHLDDHRCRDRDARYRSALAFEPIDHPPLVARAPFPKHWTVPPPWSAFERYPYSVAFHDPVAMMQNQLLDYVVPGLVIGDDSPLAIRNDHGTIQIASLLGASWQMHGDNYPWVEPLRDDADLEAIARGGDVDLERGGVMSISRDTLELYRRKLMQFGCADRIQVSLPDLQGPIDVAEQLRGSELFIDLYESPQLVETLLDRVTTTVIQVAECYRALAVDRLDPTASTQHGYVLPGRLLIRNDTAIMISPGMYAEQVRPHDARLLEALGGGSIHFCGNGEHLIDAMLEIPALRGLDFGQSQMMDMQSVFARCRARHVALTNVQPGRDALMSGDAARAYPSGAVLVYPSVDIEDALAVVGSSCAAAH
ncbi:MAG: hypothetical protein CMJ18_04125 [Phycisphaeraceae bacterium]|nr:hypothetical protein [Phycisphaeraceae bacterium]